MIAEYLWLDKNLHMRSKSRVISKSLYQSALTKYGPGKQIIIDQLPKWSYDGSSTGQLEVDDSEATLVPVNYIKHPFKSGTGTGVSNGAEVGAILVLCEAFDVHRRPVIGNSRTTARKVFAAYEDHQITFGLEQEFFFFDMKTKKPLGWKGAGETKQGEYYCGVNRSSIIESEIMDQLFSISLKVGLSMSGINQEVAPAQWEYQIGPVIGIEAADQMIFAKYILFKLCQKHGLYANFHPKPLKGAEWNGSGCHINISTVNTMQTGGGKYIENMLKYMEEDHEVFVAEFCGANNEMRLSGTHETSDPAKFSYSVGGRNASVRIPIDTALNCKGYFEDRRPGSSIDYYNTLARYTKYLNKTED
jgi:glutamine synthetase